MPSGLIALLDDVATIAKLAASSIDDVAGAAGKASAKAAGVVVDDTAVTPRYVTGLSPERELPIIAKITVGSLRNKLFFILPVALLLSAFAPFLITPLLMIGGSYLAFEAAEKIIEMLTGDHHDEEALMEADTPQELEARQIAGAIRTDFILSAEIMAIALATLETEGLATQAAALVAVAIAITLGVYGFVALVVKLDDMGLHMVGRKSPMTQKIGSGLVHGVPYLLSGLAGIGTAAMLWVGGGILVHGMEDLHFGMVPDVIHRAANWLSSGAGFFAPVVAWLAMAVGSAAVGLVVGGIIAGALHLLHQLRHPGREEPLC